MTAPKATGRGVGSAMCAHSIEHARRRRFKAMQFNFVVSSNDRAVRLWQRHGFRIVGNLPRAFLHPDGGYTDAYVMYPELLFGGPGRYQKASFPYNVRERYELVKCAL